VPAFEALDRRRKTRHLQPIQVAWSRLLLNIPMALTDAGVRAG